MKPSVLVTRPLPQVALDKLAEAFTLDVNQNDRPLKKEEIIDRIKNKEILLCLLTDSIDKSIFEAGNQLKIISNYAVGFNNIDIQEANRRKIPVCITPGILTDATADLAFALILAATRRIVEADKFVRAGLFKGWGPSDFLGCDISGKTLGIIGMGRIGQALAQRGRGFNMKIVYHGQRDQNLDDATFMSLPELLKTADIISIHVPLTPKTTHLIGEKELKSMKPSAYLINTARGPIVDEEALVQALKNKTIAGAGLDVYEHEPALTPGLAKLHNVVLLPHIGSATEETRTRMAIMAVENIMALWAGKKPHAIANPEVLSRTFKNANE